MAWMFVIPGIVLSLVASIRLRWIYGKYHNVRFESGVSGFEAARRILDANGLSETPIIEISGHLTDHYDLLKNQLCLSSENYRGGSVSAISIAAHETGHALQQHAGYQPFRIRTRLIPIASFATPLSAVLISVGLFMSAEEGHTILLSGVALFALATVFRLMTVPVELDASRRGKEQLVELGLVSDHETKKISTVLHAAAMTYLAGLVDFSGLFSFKNWK
jgi:Zn-dependent membrane protease YugP